MTSSRESDPEPAGPKPGSGTPPAWLAELSSVAPAPPRRPQGTRRWRRFLRRTLGWPAGVGRVLRSRATRRRQPAPPAPAPAPSPPSPALPRRGRPTWLAAAGAFAAVLALVAASSAVLALGPSPSMVAKELSGSAAAGELPTANADAASPTAAAPTPVVTGSPAGEPGRRPGASGASGPDASPLPAPPAPAPAPGAPGAGGPGPEPEHTATRESAEGSVNRVPWSAVVDNSSGRFNASSEWSTASAGQQHGSSYHYATPVLRSDPGWYRFDLPVDGRYRVEVWFPASSSHNDRTPYIVATTGGNQTVHINQQRNGGRWVSLGEFQLAAGDANVVAVSRWREGGGRVVADAVRITQV